MEKQEILVSIERLKASTCTLASISSSLDALANPTDSPGSDSNQPVNDSNQPVDDSTTCWPPAQRHAARALLLYNAAMLYYKSRGQPAKNVPLVNEQVRLKQWVQNVGKEDEGVFVGKRTLQLDVKAAERFITHNLGRDQVKQGDGKDNNGTKQTGKPPNPLQQRSAQKVLKKRKSKTKQAYNDLLQDMLGDQKGSTPERGTDVDNEQHKPT